MGYDVPAELVRAILEGRCIAFVGAGFSARVVPSWRSLLERIAEKLGQTLELDPSPTALQLELAGQRLQDAAGGRWEKTVLAVMKKARRDATPEAREQLDARVRRLESIPFKAILTTNFDPFLSGSDTTPSTYWEVLRDQGGWWRRAPQHDATEARRPPVVKLHGDANGNPKRSPLVLGRTDYRRRVYEDQSYAGFLRAAFAGYTFLFLGVSFTDAYLNELRSEVLSTIREAHSERVWGYAVMNRPSPALERDFRRYEGLQILPDPTEDHTGFDQWLEALSSATSVEGRLRALLEGRRVVWVDPQPQNNQRGYTLLTESSRCTVERLSRHDELRPEVHADASVLLTHFGFEGPGRAHAFRVLETIASWGRRPPAIVFANPGAPEVLRANREECLRRGAFEYAVQWGELYRAIERLLGHTPGEWA